MSWAIGPSTRRPPTFSTRSSPPVTLANEARCSRPTAYALQCLSCLMQTVLLCGVPSSETPWVGHFGTIPLRIKEPDVRDAISLSVALKRPERSFGGITDSRASIFTDGSARVYISVVCMCAWPSHSATFLKSLVACRTVRAQVCLKTCGDTRFVASDGQR